MNEDLRQQAERILRDEVAPALELDGRGIEVVAVADGIASVRLGAACASCPAGIPLLIQQMEAELKARLPGIEMIEIAL